MAFIARDKNGVAQCAVTEDKKLSADAIAEWLRDGMTVERVSDAWVRQHLFTDALSSAPVSAEAMKEA